MSGANDRPASCDILVENGFVITGDEAAPILNPGSVAIAGNRILDVGPAASLAGRYEARRTLDAAGRIVMPGLVNTHNHSPLMISRGVVEDLGFAPAYTPNIPQGHALSDEEALALARLGLYEMLRFGSTTVVDYYNHADACARAAAEIGLRAYVGGRIHDADMEALTRREWRYDVKIGEATLRENLDLVEKWDGAEEGRIRCVLGPHAADTCSLALLKEVARIAEKTGLSVHTHLAQSVGEVERVVERDGRPPSQVFDELGLLSGNLIAGHCIHLSDEEIARIGRSGVRVAHSPFGNAVSGRIAPIHALEEAGATITLCTDTKSGDMFEAMRMAVSVARIRGAGYELGAETAFRWATANGAAALSAADEFGRLQRGMLADLLLLDATAPNLRPLVGGLGLVVYSAVGMNVDTVIVDGRVLIEGGEPVAFDGAAVVEDAQRAADGLWRRYGRG
jgi:5-methylthioadenosine/S-adenosylhomocysteine deaminase